MFMGNGGVQPNKLAEDRTGIINKTIVSVLEGKYLHEKIPSFVTLETYDEMHSLGGSGLGGTNLEALQWWILKFGKDIKRIRTIVETFVDWITNKGPP